MTDPSNSPDKPYEPVTPTRHDRLRPLELLGFSGVLAIFAGAVVLLTTRDFVLTGIAVVIGFIAVVMMVALVGLGGKPSEEDVEARKDLQNPDKEGWH